MFIFLLISGVLSLSFNKQNILYAINAGDVQKVIVNGVTYNEDQYFSSNSHPIENMMKYKQIQKLTNDDRRLLSNGRYSEEQTFQYELPLSRGPGQYQLLLIFIEEPNKRLFDVRLGDHYIARHLDVYGESKSLPFHLDVRFTLSPDETIQVGNHTCFNAYKFKTNALVIEFDRIYGSEIPKVEALVLFWGHINNITNYYGWEEQADKDKDQKQEKNKKFSEMLVLQTSSMYQQDGHFESLLDVLLSIKGLILFLFIYSMVICVVCYDDSNEDQEENRKIAQDKLNSGGKSEALKVTQQKKRKKRD